MNVVNVAIDARGLSCPQPVLLTNQAIEKGVFPITILVDSAAAKANICRMVLSKKLDCKAEDKNGETIITIKKK